MLINLKKVASACYDKQHVCTYLQPFSHYNSQYRQNNVFDALVRGEPFHPAKTKTVTKTRILGAVIVKIS